MTFSLATLPNNQLLSRLRALIQRGNTVEAELLSPGSAAPERVRARQDDVGLDRAQALVVELERFEHVRGQVGDDHVRPTPARHMAERFASFKPIVAGNSQGMRISGNANEKAVKRRGEHDLAR